MPKAADPGSRISAPAGAGSRTGRIDAWATRLGRRALGWTLALLLAAGGTSLSRAQGTGDGLVAPELLGVFPLSLRTQNAFEIASQRNFGGPRTAGLIGSVCSACLSSGTTQGLNALAAQGFAQGGASLPGLNVLAGGNQFAGQAVLPQTFAPTFQNPLAAAGNFDFAIGNALNLLNWGTGANAPFNFGTSALLGFDPLFSGGGFSGFAQGGALPPSRALATRALPRAAHEAVALSPVEWRYLRLAERQADLLYADETLSALRAESHTQQLLFLYNDPLLSHLSQELRALLQQILAASASQAEADALAQELAFHLPPSDDDAELEARYRKRLRLAELNAQAAAEARAHLAQHPALAQRLLDLAHRHLELTRGIAGSPQARAHAEEWARRFQAAFAHSPGFPALVQELEQLFADFPALREYLQLNQETAALLATFDRHPRALEVNGLIEQANADPGLLRQVAGLQQQFAAEVQALLEDTGYMAEVERGHERMNALLESEPGFRLLRDTQSLALQALDGLQQRIHELVAQCLAAHGPGCDPYRDPQVLALLPASNGESFELLVAAGRFHEQHNRFLYGFARSEAVQALHAETMSRVQDSLAAVLPGLHELREDFEHRLHALPEVAAIDTAVGDLADTLLAESPELRSRLARMAALRQELTGR